MRPTPRLSIEPRRIVLIKPSALGDIVHSLPVLTALRKRFPAAHLAWVVGRSYLPLVQGHPHLDEVIPFERTALRGGFRGMLGYCGFLQGLRARRFDLAIDLQCLFRTALMTIATGARYRVGLSSAREGARFFYTHLVPDDLKREHAVDRYWRVAEAMGCAGEKRVHVPVDPDAEVWARTMLHAYPRPWLAIGVGARWLTKRWLPRHFGILAQRAQREFGGTAVFVGAADEAGLAEEAASYLTGPVCHLSGKTTMPQVIALLAQVDAMVANDTGPLHLAVALGRPVVAPYTCTRVGVTGPYGQQARAIATTVACAGSLFRTCSRMDCMAELTPDRLWPALQQILDPWQLQRRSAV